MDVVFAGLAHWHVPMHLAAARRAGLQVRGGWDPDPARAKALGMTVLSSLDAALAARPDLVVVTGTPAEMAERLPAVVRAGCPALVEKPLCTTGAGLAALVDDLAGPESWVAVALPHHAGPLAHADCGEPRHLAVRLVNGRPARYRAWGVPWVLDPAVGGGGALRNLGIHGIDLARLLLGPGTRITAAALRHWHGEPVEDHAVVHLAAPGGATATVEAGYLHPDDSGSDFEARLLGSRAVAVDDGATLLVHDASGPRRLEVTPQPSRYDDLMADVAARLRAGRPPAATLRDLRDAMLLIDDAYALAEAR